MPQIVPTPISHDTIEALSTLLRGAKTGDITGIAFAAMFKRGRYFTDAAGTCYKNPTFALGMVRILADELALRAHARSDAGETR